MESIFGEYLRLLRIDRGMSLRQVEKITKISNSYLSQIERGERNIPNFSILKRLAEAYGVKVTDFFEHVEGQTGNIMPDVSFISRGYEKLSEGRKQSLKDFLQHLVEQEEKK